MFYDTQEPTKTFELTVNLRNSKGELTGERKTYASDSAYSIWKYWIKHVSKVPTKKNKVVSIPSAQEAEKILKDLYANK
jgi:hypothetical protein